MLYSRGGRYGYIFITIPYLYQHQPLWWCRHSGFRTLSGFQDLLHPFRCVKTSPHTDQCSGYNPNHIIEEPISRNPDTDILAILIDHNIIHCTDRIGRIRSDIAKAYKIMLSDQIRCSFPHLVYVQWKGYKCRCPTFHGIRHRRIANVILICLCNHILIAWMPVIRHLFRSKKY